MTPILFPIMVLSLTVLLWLPTRFLNQKKAKYLALMKETVWVETLETVDRETIRSAMVHADQTLRTTQIRQATYDHFVAALLKEYMQTLNASSLSNATKIAKLEKAEHKLTMNFAVPALEQITEAKDKLSGKVAL